MCLNISLNAFFFISKYVDDVEAIRPIKAIFWSLNSCAVVFYQMSFPFVCYLFSGILYYYNLFEHTSIKIRLTMNII